VRRQHRIAQRAVTSTPVVCSFTFSFRRPHAGSAELKISVYRDFRAHRPKWPNKTKYRYLSFESFSEPVSG